MMNFREYLDEAAFDAKWLRPAAELVFTYTAFIPFTPKVIKSLSDEKSYAFHMTDFSGVRGVIGSQKRKNTLSVTKITNSSVLHRGVHRSGVVCVLKGSIPFGQGWDIDSQPDFSGVRWVQGQEVYDHGPTQIDRLKKLKKKFLDQFMREAGVPDTYDKTTQLYVGIQSGKFPKDIVQKYIRIYMVMIEKFIKKYPPTAKYDDSRHDNYTWDEFLMSNYTVQYVYIHREEKYDDDPAPYSPLKTKAYAQLENFLRAKGIRYEHIDFIADDDRFETSLREWLA